MPSRIKRLLRLGLWLLPILLLAASGAWAWWWVQRALQPVRGLGAPTVVVEIPAGASTTDVANLLYQHGLIRSAVVFRYYARYRNLDGQLKPGEYIVTGAMSPDDILEKLSHGDVVILRFTVPEGLTLSETADLLAEHRVVDKHRFLQFAAESRLADSFIPGSAKLSQRLEGYLFPATYEYQRGATEQDILLMMFQRFEQTWSPELRQQAQNLGLSVHEVVTLASIVEREARVDKERPIIAGVYLNRFKGGMKLDADPTVRYALHKPPKEDLLLTDLQTDSPYNTYKQPGLPPGPIAAPGEASIRAVLYPAKHDYWYFVAKGDGSGEHYFAKTLDEQTANIARSQHNRQPSR